MVPRPRRLALLTVLARYQELSQFWSAQIVAKVQSGVQHGASELHSLAGVMPLRTTQVLCGHCIHLPCHVDTWLAAHPCWGHASEETSDAV